MKLSDVVNPEDSDLLKPVRGNNGKMTMRELVRSKSFKSMVKSLSSKNNPKDEDHNEYDLAGDGNDESDGAAKDSV